MEVAGGWSLSFSSCSFFLCWSVRSVMRFLVLGGAPPRPGPAWSLSLWGQTVPGLCHQPERSESMWGLQRGAQTMQILTRWVCSHMIPAAFIALCFYWHENPGKVMELQKVKRRMTVMWLCAFPFYLQVWHHWCEFWVSPAITDTL